MKYDAEIACIVSARYVRKCGKNIVKLAFPDERAREYWMSPLQYDHLCDAFDATPRQHSTGKVKVIGVFDDSRYCYCRVERMPWQPPRQYNLSDLEDLDDEAENANVPASAGGG